MASNKLRAIEKRLGSCSLESFAEMFAPFQGVSESCIRIRQQVFVVACNKNRIDILEFMREGKNKEVKQHGKAAEFPIDRGLMTAIKKHNFETVSYLVETFRPDLNLPRKGSTTPLLAAIKESQVAIARFLMEHGARLSKAKDEYNSAIHYACCHIRGSREMLQFLLSKGAPVDAVNYMGYTALHMTCMARRDDMVTCLLRHGASVDREAPGGRTPLVLACHADNVAVVKLLLVQMSLVSSTSAWHKTGCGYPVEIAARTGRLTVLKEMLKCYVRPSNYKFDGSRTLLHVAADYARGDIVKCLVTEHGYDPNVRDAHGKTPLHVLYNTAHGWMDERKDEECIRILARAGAVLDSLDQDGSAPIHYAVMRRDLKVLQTLLDLGASTSTRDCNGRTALLLVCTLATTCTATTYHLACRDTNHDHHRNCSKTIFDDIGLLLCSRDADDSSAVADHDGNLAFIWAAASGQMDSSSFELLRMVAHRGFFETPKRGQQHRPDDAVTPLYPSSIIISSLSSMMRPTKRLRTD